MTTPVQNATPGSKSTRARKFDAAVNNPDSEAALREVIVDRRAAAQLYQMLGVALGKSPK